MIRDEMFDTIVAPITGSAPAPVAIIRVSGPEAWRIGIALAGRALKGREPVARRAYFIRIEDFDEGYITFFAEGRSYTGEASFEISLHGSPANVRRAINLICSLGARPARPGEFTERAFFNGRLDLVQAEAVVETVNAASEMQSRRAAALRRGALTAEVEALRERAAAIIARIEASVEFTDEVGELDTSGTIEAIHKLREDVLALAAGTRAARIVRDGFRICLVGRTNVGKSSLLNRILGADRAIVTEVPGTTRDTIEESVSLGGFRVIVTDTAGLRETDDPVERIGIERAVQALSAADEIWHVVEAPSGYGAADKKLEESLPRKPDLYVVNKADLGEPLAPPPGAWITVSALEGAGMDALLDGLQARLENVLEHGLPLTNERHEAHLRQAAAHLLAAADALLTEPPDLACVPLYAALDAFGEITGATAPDELIERVFRDFCVGK
jgi:tRNA modification GTPase